MSFNDYLQQRFEGVEGTDELRDITEHGLSGGVNGFTYYNELYTLFRVYEEEILDYLMEQCGMSLSDLAIDCFKLDDIAQNAVWMYVEDWAHREYEERMITLEELNDENMNLLMEQAYA